MKKQTKKMARRTAPARKTTALAVRRRVAPKPVVTPAAVPTADLATLPSDPVMALGWIGTFKLTGPQIKELRRPVTDAEIEWKPARKGGPPEIPYLAHNGYRDRFDAAFGLGGWGLAPVGQPKEKDGVVYVPYALVVDGVPRAYVWGEQAYHPDNKQMTWGDALEGAKSNGVVRLGKDLGVARELWDRKYLDALKQRVPVHARFSASGYQEPQRQQPYAPQHSGAPRHQPPVPEQQPWRDSRGGDVISEKQAGRMWVIARNAGRGEDEEVRPWLRRRFGIDSAKDVTRRDYEFICSCLEAPGMLPEK